MNILSIGNSFSNDAQRYLNDLAKKEGENINCANLLFGACDLRVHYLNALNDYKKYLFEVNGVCTNLKVSIREALESREWDYVTLQQASLVSGDFDTYFPYTDYLVEEIKKRCPKAKILVNQTWAYEKDSSPLAKTKYNTPKDMFKDISNAYKKMAKRIKVKTIIPCGEVMLNLAEKGLKMHRDGKHASLGAGRYALALTWYKVLTNKSVLNNNFIPFDGELSEGERKLVIEEVEKI